MNNLENKEMNLHGNVLICLLVFSLLIFVNVFIAFGMEQESNRKNDTDQALSEKITIENDLISLDFFQADVTSVLRLLADMKEMNILFDGKIKGMVTLKLKDVSWDEAMNSVLDSNSLVMVRKGNVITVLTVNDYLKKKNR